MKKIILVIVSLFLLTSCSNSSNEILFPVKPEELNDCKFYSLSNESGISLYVVRCPLSATTVEYSEGKTTRSVIVVDGQEYIKK